MTNQKKLPRKKIWPGLTEEMGLLEVRGWAFAVNDTIIPKTQLKDTVLMEGDRILLIKATQGG